MFFVNFVRRFFYFKRESLNIFDRILFYIFLKFLLYIGTFWDNGTFLKAYFKLLFYFIYFLFSIFLLLIFIKV